jgi:hypothetical protein
LFLFLLSTFWFPSSGYAACFSPAGNAGDVIYYGGYQSDMYCNGGAWVSMGGPVGNTTNNLVGWWKLDDGAGTSAVDSSGNGNTGTLNNSPTWTTSGMNGGALTFNGTNQYLSAPNAPSLDLTTFTVSVWVNFSSPPSTYVTLISNYAGGVSDNYNLTLQGGNYQVCSFQDAGANFRSTGLGWVPTPGVWYQVACTFDGSTISLYINGALAASSPQPYTPKVGTSGLTIGASHTHTTYFFPGTIDDIRVYNRALSATDIKTLYTSTGGGSGDINTGLKGYWKFDEGSGTAANDSSGNNNAGTLTNSPTWTTSGKINDALTFNGTNSYVTMGNVASMNSLTAVTVSAWIKSSSSGANAGAGNDHEVVDKSICTGAANDGPFELMVSNAGSEKASFAVYPSGGVPGNVYISGDSTTNVDDGNWHLLVGTYDGSNASIWVDGTLQNFYTLGAVTLSSNTNPFEIGGCVNGATFIWSGTIDDVRVYSRALSPSDVLTLYNTTATACASPVGYTGDFIYNSASHVYQFCNASNWIPMGPVPGAGGGGCSSPAGSEGNIIYNADNHITQYCDGANWVAAGENIPISGLVGWWNFDEGSGTSAADSSGGGNTGTLTNGPTWTTSGKINGALTFNGTNQYVSIPDAAALRLSGSWTVTTWVNPSALPSSGNIALLASKSTSVGTNYDLVIDNGRYNAGLGWAVDFNSSGCCDDHFAKYVTSISTGTWYHVAGVYDSVGQTVTLYLNGMSVASSSVAGSPPESSIGGNLAIGAIGTGLNFYTAGTIDDTRVYSRALTASEVWRLYNGAP